MPTPTGSDGHLSGENTDRKVLVQGRPEARPPDTLTGHLSGENIDRDVLVQGRPEARPDTLTGHLSGENTDSNAPVQAAPEGRNSYVTSRPKPHPHADIKPPHGPKGWFSRGYLPHFDRPNTIQHVTIHLADSLPLEVVRQMDAEMQAKPWYKRDARRLAKIEQWLKAGRGSCVLRDPNVAAMTQDTLLYFDGLRYRLIAWVVMPNHVHVLFEPIHGWPLNKIVASWKRHTAMEILAVHQLAKPVWHHEYFDRFVRSERHLYNVIEYIHRNPVKAGLVRRAEDWAWSSARQNSGLAG